MMSEIDKLKQRLASALQAQEQVEKTADIKIREIYARNQELVTVNDNLNKSIARYKKQLQFTESMVAFLKESPDFTIFFKKILRSISELFDFSFAHFYEYKKESDQLESSNIFFFTEKSKYQYFSDITRKTPFKKKAGLPGTAWEKMEVIYFPNVLKSTDFIRARLAEKPINVIGGIALPIIYEGNLKGVIEFYSDEMLTLNEEEIKQFKYLSDSIGIYYGTSQENKNLKIVFNNLEAAVFGADMEGKIIFVNPKACEVLGYSEEQLMERAIDKILGKRSHLSGIYATLRNGMSHHVEGEYFLHATGKEIMVEYSSTPIYKDQRINGVVVVLTDVSEKKRIKNYASTISIIQERYIEEGYSKKLFACALQHILHLTNSQAGFIAFVVKDNRGEENNEHYAISNTELNKNYYDFDEDNSFEKCIFVCLENIFRYLKISNSPLICNGRDAGEDLKRFFKSYEKNFHSFLAIPVCGQDGILAIVAIFDKAGGYDEKVLTELKPLMDTLSNIVKLNHRNILIEDMDSKDMLTGAYSYNYFKNVLQDTLEEYHEKDKIFCLMMLDLNNFKRVNDFYGYEVGDALLVLFSQRMSSSLRAPHTLTRIGGDKFIAILRNIPEYNSVVEIVERIMEVANNPYKIENKEIFCGPSIGIAKYPVAGKTEEELIRHVDFALYQAKKSEKKWQIYTDVLEKKFTELVMLEHDIEEGFNKEAFYCLYQPQVNILTGTICGVEQLMRWKHSKKGEISPEEFIPVIERMGRAESINQYALQYLAKKISCFNPISPLIISINLSPVVRDMVNHIESVVGILKECHCHSNIKVEFEITESSFIGRTKEFEEKLKDSMERLSSNGIGLAVDNFGVEYTFINRLINHRFSTIKIDKLFVQNLDGEESLSAKAVIKTILSLAKDFDFRVIAEGVETEEQVNILRELGCCIAQGFYFYKPLTLEEVALLVNQ